MTTTVTRSMVVAPALAALLALSCGRSLTLDDRPGSAGRGAGGSSSSISDGGDAASRGGAIGAAGTGAGGAVGTGEWSRNPMRLPIESRTRTWATVSSTCGRRTSYPTVS